MVSMVIRVAIVNGLCGMVAVDGLLERIVVDS